MTDTTNDEWVRILALEAKEREEQVASIFRALAEEEEAQRRESLSALVRSEYELPDEALRPFTISRLRAFLALDPEAGARVAHSYDAVMQSMPAAVAMRRVAMVQSVVSHFSAEDEDRLRELIPNVFAGAPGHRGVAAPAVARASEKAGKSRPFWAVWRKA